MTLHVSRTANSLLMSPHFIISMVDEIHLKIHKFRISRSHIVLPARTQEHYVAHKWKWTAPADCIIFFDRCSLDYWSFSMTGNIWGGQQSPAHSSGAISHLNSMLWQDVDTREMRWTPWRGRPYTSSPCQYPCSRPAVKTITLCLDKCRDAAVCRDVLCWEHFKCISLSPCIIYWSKV